MKKGQLDGQGQYYYNDGSYYEGNFLNNQKSGKGKIIIKVPKGQEMYEGQFLNDIFEGKGKYSFIDGDIYEGEFVEGYAEGLGVITHANGEMFKGKFEKNMKHGPCVYIINVPNINEKLLKYQGEFAFNLEKSNSCFPKRF